MQEIENLVVISKDQETIVIVPAEDVLLLDVKFPKMNRSRMLQALPFALEERLIADVEDLHFAVGAQQSDGILSVAVVSHQKMQQWLSLLRSRNIHADYIVPLTLALPYDPTHWYVHLHKVATVRTGPLQGFACDKNNFVEFVDLAFNAASVPPKGLHIHNYTNRAYANDLLLSAIVKEEFLSESSMMSDVKFIPPLNLLQGRYANKKSRFTRLKLSWKVAGYLATGWLFLLFFYPFISALILDRRINSIDNQIAAIYKRYFPKQNEMVAPVLQMQEQLQHLSGRVGENKAMLIIGYIGKAAQETSGIRIKRIDFQNDELTLELTAVSQEAFSNFADYLIHQGLHVTQQNGSLIEGRISAILLVKN